MRRGSKWSARMLAVVALLWAWSGLPTLGERFVDACKVARKAFRWLPRTGETYQGFMKQLRKWHFALKVLGMGELRAVMQQDLFGQWKIAGYVIIAGDGSRVELPRTESNEAAYSPKRKKQGSQRKHRGKTKANRGRRGKQWRRARRQSKEADLEKDEQPANVADVVLACGNRFAVGLENRSVGFQRATAPAGDAGRIAGKLVNYGRCGLCGLRFLA